MLDSSWPKTDAAFDRVLRSAGGILHDRFAFCQEMPLAEFMSVAEGLRKSHYRPVRFRPYADGPVVKVAAVWGRDEWNWRIERNLSSEGIRGRDERNRSDKFIPVDVAGYISKDNDGKPVDRYAALWVEKSDDDDAQMYVGETEDKEASIQDRSRIGS